MILTHDDLKIALDCGDIECDPYPTKIGPNSFDVRLDVNMKRLVLAPHHDAIIPESLLSHRYETEPVAYSGADYVWLLKPGELYLANTVERICSKYYVPLLEGRSSWARLGVQIHISAGFGDVGFDGQWTLEITVVKPTYIFAGCRIGQVYFLKPSSKPTVLYNGKYQMSTGVVGSRLHEEINP
jgi:dCTP deaminase